MLSEGMEGLTNGQSPKASHRPPECSTQLCCVLRVRPPSGFFSWGEQAGSLVTEAWFQLSGLLPLQECPCISSCF